MANREACELYIEQEIKDGLREGKKPYSIGKELSQWVEKMFETVIPANTIKNRAARLMKESDSNESKQSETPASRASTFGSGRGGKREGAGRRSAPDAWESAFNQYDRRLTEIKTYVGILHRQPEWKENKLKILNMAQDIVYYINE